MYLYENRYFMKKTLKETQQRIFEIMSQMDSSLLITELNLDTLLDKVSKGGMGSLNPHEKNDLIKLSNDENVPTPDRNELDDFPDKNKLRDEGRAPLRFTSEAYADDELENMENYSEIINAGKTKFEIARIHGKAEHLAGHNLPMFIDGDMLELDKPIDQQYIIMVLPSGEYECTSTPTNISFASTLTKTGQEDIKRMVYYLMLKEEHDDDVI